MAEHTEITVGTPVLGTDGRPLGVVEAMDGEALTVGAQTIPRAAVGRVDAHGVHLGEAVGARPPRAGAAATPGGTAAAGADRLVVPLVEERLAVGTRPVDLGEVEIRKRVVEETVMQPVTLRREIVEVVHRDAEGNEIGAQELPPPASAPGRG